MLQFKLVHIGRGSSQCLVVHSKHAAAQFSLCLRSGCLEVWSQQDTYMVETSGLSSFIDLMLGSMSHRHSCCTKAVGKVTEAGWSSSERSGWWQQ